MMGVLQRWVLHNFWLKALSLLLATGMWLAISPDQAISPTSTSRGGRSISSEPRVSVLGSSGLMVATS